MGFFIFIDYLIGLIVLIRIHAPWWAWLIYVGSALFWFVILAFSSGGADKGTINSHKNQSE